MYFPFQLRPDEIPYLTWVQRDHAGLRIIQSSPGEDTRYHHHINAMLLEIWHSVVNMMGAG